MIGAVAGVEANGPSGSVGQLKGVAEAGAEHPSMSRPGMPQYRLCVRNCEGFVSSDMRSTCAWVATMLLVPFQPRRLVMHRSCRRRGLTSLNAHGDTGRQGHRDKHRHTHTDGQTCMHAQTMNISISIRNIGRSIGRTCDRASTLTEGGTFLLWVVLEGRGLSVSRVDLSDGCLMGESFITVLQVVLDVMLEFREQKHFEDRRKDLRIFLQCLAPHLGKRVVGL